MSGVMPLFAANWKMHKSPVETAEYVSAFEALYAPRADRRVVFFPPAISVPAFAHATRERPDLEYGVQDVHEEAEGAHTGAISAAMAAQTGARWVLAGHSERRREFGDDDRRVAGKVLRILEAGMSPILCVGETLEEREAGFLSEILARQVRTVLAAVPEEHRRDIAYAYEPVWAIGTGRTASPEDAAGAHALLRGHVAEFVGESGSTAVPVLYGGSVKPANIEWLMRMDGVDGVLVGGASLDPVAFSEICSAPVDRLRGNGNGPFDVSRADP